MNPQPLTYEEADSRYRRISLARHEAREDLERRGNEAAEAEAIYRKLKAQEYAKARAGGESTEGAKTIAEGKAADARKDWAMKQVLVKACEEKLEELDGNRAMLTKRVEWSMKLTPEGQGPEPREVQTYGARRAA